MIGNAACAPMIASVDMTATRAKAHNGWVYEIDPNVASQAFEQTRIVDERMDGARHDDPYESGPRQDRKPRLAIQRRHGRWSAVEQDRVRDPGHRTDREIHDDPPWRFVIDAAPPCIDLSDVRVEVRCEFVERVPRPFRYVMKHRHDVRKDDRKNAAAPEAPRPGPRKTRPARTSRAARPESPHP
jgi:hypothetical protein